MNKRVIPIALLTLFLGLPTPLSVATSASEEVDINIEKSSPLTDLSYLDDFNPYAERQDFEALYFAEYGYDGVTNNDFGLYFYCYLVDTGPDLVYGTEAKMKMDVSNDITAALEDNAIEYDLTLIQVDSMFCKYRIEDTEDLIPTSDDIRYYSLYSFEPLLHLGPLNLFGERRKIWDYSYSCRATFSVKGTVAHANVASNMEMTADIATEVPLEVEGTTWVGNDFIGERNVIFESYFELPEHLKSTYGDLYSIHFEYDKLLTDFLFHFRSNSFGSTISLFPQYMPFSDGFVPNFDYIGRVGPDGRSYRGDIAIRSLNLPDNVTEKIAPVRQFRHGYWDDKVPSEDIISRVKSYPELILCSNHFEETIINTSFDLGSISSHYNFDWITKTSLSFLFGVNTIEDESLEDIKFMESISLNDANNLTVDEFAYKYLISDDADYFKRKASLAFINDKIPMLFRFTTGYMSSMALYSKSSTFNRPSIGYEFMTELIRNFDILDLTFEKSGELTVIPVVADPIWVSPNVEAPEIHKTAINSLISILIAIALLVLGVWLFVQVILPLLKSLFAERK